MQWMVVWRRHFDANCYPFRKKSQSASSRLAQWIGKWRLAADQRDIRGKENFLEWELEVCGGEEVAVQWKGGETTAHWISIVCPVFLDVCEGTTPGWQLLEANGELRMCEGKARLPKLVGGGGYGRVGRWVGPAPVANYARTNGFDPPGLLFGRDWRFRPITVVKVPEHVDHKMGKKLAKLNQWKDRFCAIFLNFLVKMKTTNVKPLGEVLWENGVILKGRTMRSGRPRQNNKVAHKPQ